MLVKLPINFKCADIICKFALTAAICSFRTASAPTYFLVCGSIPLITMPMLLTTASYWA